MWFSCTLLQMRLPTGFLHDSLLYPSSLQSASVVVRLFCHIPTWDEIRSFNHSQWQDAETYVSSKVGAYGINHCTGFSSSNPEDHTKQNNSQSVDSWILILTYFKENNLGIRLMKNLRRTLLDLAKGPTRSSLLYFTIVYEMPKGA